MLDIKLQHDVVSNFFLTETISVFIEENISNEDHDI